MDNFESLGGPVSHVSDNFMIRLICQEKALLMVVALVTSILDSIVPNMQ